MARASSLVAVSARLIRSMHACRPVLRRTGVVLDRYGGGTCSWRSGTMEAGFRVFGTMSSPPRFIENEGVDPPVSIPVEEAYNLHKAGHRYLDVRTMQEFDEGHVSGAVNIAYLISAEGGMAKNPRFLEEVGTGFGRDEKIIVGCRSGKRSLMAVADLISAGYSKAMNMEGGYMAWPDKD